VPSTDFFGSTRPSTPSVGAIDVSSLPPVPTLTPAPLSFPNTVVQQVSSGLTTTLTNPGSAPITVSAITNTGTNANQFALTSGCPAVPFSLAAGGTCSLTERFAPTSTGAKAATLSVTSSTGNVSANLTGNGILGSSTLTISPASIPFGTVPLGTASAPQNATVQNTGNFPALFTSVATSGDFAVTNNCTNASLSDTFATGSLDLTKWAIDTGNIGSQTLGTASTGSAANVDLSQGVLGLKLTQATAANSVGAEVRSLNSFSYGTYEFTARASSVSATKLGAGSAVTGGVTGLFNFVNNSQTEIDFEVESQSTGTLEMTNWAGTANKTATTQAEAGMDTAFHTYKFVWMPDHIDYYFDGALISTHSTNIPNTPAPILLNHWGTNSASFGGVASVGTTRWMYVSSVKFTPALAPQASCNLPLVFTPTAAGARTGTLTVTSNASNSPNTASLDGHGCWPGSAVDADHTCLPQHRSGQHPSVRIGGTQEHWRGSAALNSQHCG
jgi:beta-glucanase (GH16 family)